MKTKRINQRGFHRTNWARDKPAASAHGRRGGRQHTNSSSAQRLYALNAAEDRMCSRLRPVSLWGTCYLGDDVFCNYFLKQTYLLFIYILLPILIIM